MFEIATSSGTLGSEVERHRGRWNRLGVIDRQRCQAAVIANDGRQRHLRIVGAGHVDALQIGRIALELRIDLQHHHVLVALGIDDRDLPLRERVVQGVIDVLDADAERGGGVAVDRQRELQPGGIAVGGNVGDALDRLHALGDDGGPFPEQVDVDA